MEKQIVVLAYEKATKNKYVYQAEAVDGPQPLGSLYIEKWAVGDRPPTRLTVTVEDLT